MSIVPKELMDELLAIKKLNQKLGQDEICPKNYLECSFQQKYEIASPLILSDRMRVYFCRGVSIFHAPDATDKLINRKIVKEVRRRLRSPMFGYTQQRWRRVLFLTMQFEDKFRISKHEIQRRLLEYRYEVTLEEAERVLCMACYEHLKEIGYHYDKPDRCNP